MVEGLHSGANQGIKPDSLHATRAQSAVQPSLFTPPAALAPIDKLNVSVNAPSEAMIAELFDDANRPEDELESISMAELARLGAQKDKTAFFQTLLPGAVAAEKLFGVPASVSLAQAAYESAWGKHAIGGYNLFGIKGTGPAGTRLAWTHERIHGRLTRVQDNFAKFHSFAEAVQEHGRLFTNGAYDRAMQQFKVDHDAMKFAAAIGPIYATAKHYGKTIQAVMKSFNLVTLCEAAGGH